MFKYENVLIDVDNKDLPLSGSAGIRGFIENDPTLTVEIQDVNVTKDGLFATLISNRRMTGLYPSIVIISKGFQSESIGAIGFHTEQNNETMIPAIGQESA